MHGDAIQVLKTLTPLQSSFTAVAGLAAAFVALFIAEPAVAWRGPCGGAGPALCGSTRWPRRALKP